MKITKQIQSDYTTYFYDGVKKYKYFKDSTGYESWSDDNPNNPKNLEVKEEDVKPFTFEKN